MTTAVPVNPVADWHGPGAAERRRRIFSWKTLLWSLVFPPKRHRIAPTVTGLFLIGLAMGIGTAAYNTASNILFITLSLLLACLLLSGLMSWFNFTGVSWRLRPSGPWRAGHETFASIEVRNHKKWLPTYGLWFELLTQPRLELPDKASGRNLRVREILAGAEKLVTRGMLFMRERLEPGGSAELDWVVKPERRGEAFIELVAVGSLFPFGFLKKSIGTGLRQPVLVWPAQVEYRWSGAMAAHGGSQGQRTVRVGTGDDLLALRKYEPGDSHRLIHWKASARLGQLMIRQFAAESHDGFMLSLDTRAETWPHPEQFELLCSFAGTMAEDLYAAGRLRGVVMNGGTPFETRRLRDVENFLNDLARLQPLAATESGAGVPSPRPIEAARGGGTPSAKTGNLVTFAPAGTRGVVALVDGREIASA